MPIPIIFCLHEHIYNSFIYMERSEIALLALDRMIIKEMQEELDDFILTDELGEYIDSLADLPCDEDIINKCLGGNCDE